MTKWSSKDIVVVTLSDIESWRTICEAQNKIILHCERYRDDVVTIGRYISPRDLMMRLAASGKHPLCGLLKATSVML